MSEILFSNKEINETIQNYLNSTEAKDKLNELSKKEIRVSLPYLGDLRLKEQYEINLNNFKNSYEGKQFELNANTIFKIRDIKKELLIIKDFIETTIFKEKLMQILST